MQQHITRRSNYIITHDLWLFYIQAKQTDISTLFWQSYFMLWTWFRHWNRIVVGLTFFWPRKKDHRRVYSRRERMSISLDLPEVLLFALTTVSVSLWRTSTSSAGISWDRNDFWHAIL